MLQTTSHVFKALDEKRFFKLICGASLTDTKMVEDLSFIFTLAGAHVIDLAPKADVIFAAKCGIEKAISRGKSRLAPTPLIMASIQLDEDPHFRKVEVDYNLCDLCGACIKVCPTEAFRIVDHKEFIYLTERCFGCGICPSYCHVNALNMVDFKPTPKETLNEIISLGVKSVEFHFGKNFQKIESVWKESRSLLQKLELFSFSIGSELLTDEEIRKAANLCYKLAGRHIILQCDGAPMSGGIDIKDKKLSNGNNGDSSSFHVARVIEKEGLPVYLQISGGTNHNSFSNAIKSGLDINGVAIGSYARKLLMPYLGKLENKEKLQNAVEIARSLVNSVVETPHCGVSTEM